MANGEEEGVDAAVGPADDVGGGDVQGGEEGGEVVGHDLEGDGVVGVERLTWERLSARMTV